AGFMMLAWPRQLDLLSLGLFAVVLGVGCLIDTGRIRWSIGHRRVNWLMAGGLAFVVAEWYALGVSPVVAPLHFVFFASSLKLLKRKTARDWLWLYVVTFCQVLITPATFFYTPLLFLLI